MSKATKRTIILHYHLFKNAGTSVDTILKHNFGDKWVAREFAPMGGNNTSLIEEWIRETGEAVVYSSHTMMGPIPQVEGVRVISFMLLRDPIERIKSAYRFERAQQSDSWGAKLAKEHNFEEYVMIRLARLGDRQCRNFQTYRLASLITGQGTELERAKKGVYTLSVVGKVEAFDTAMRRLKEALSPFFGDILCETCRKNQSGQVLTEISKKGLQLLLENNQEDASIVEFCNEEIWKT